MNMEEQDTSRGLNAGTEDTKTMINKQPVTGFTYESGSDFFPRISKNQGPSGTLKKSGLEHLIYLPHFIIAIGCFQITDLVPLIDVYIQEHPYFASISVILVFQCGFCLLLFVYLPSLEWNQIQRAGICINAAVLIVMVYVTLVAVNRRYISLVIVQIIMLVFIGALCRKVSLNGSLKKDDNVSSCSEAKKADDGGSTNKDDEFLSSALRWGAHSDGRVAVISRGSAGSGGSPKGFPRGGAVDSAHHGRGAARRGRGTGLYTGARRGSPVVQQPPGPWWHYRHHRRQGHVARIRRGLP